MDGPVVAVNKPQRATRAQSTAATRVHLLDAAGDVFAEFGFNAATVEAVVGRAGYTRGAFYAHFTDKADLFLTLLELQRAGELDRVRELLATTAEEETQGVIQAWFDALARQNRWELAYAELWPQAVRNASLRARLAARHDGMRAAITEIIERHCEQAGIALPIPAVEVAVMMLAIGDGIAHQRHLDDRVLNADAFTKATMYLWAGLLSDPSGS